MAYLHHPKYKTKRMMLITSIAMLLMLLLSACGGDTQIQQKADQNKADLDKLIAHAQSIGVPNTLMTPIIQQEKNLSQTGAPLSLFSGQPVNDYNTNLSQRYKTLAVQVRGLTKQAADQTAFQATQDMKAFEDILGQRQGQGFVETKTFAGMLAQDQTMMAKGTEPKTFVQVSNDARDATQALHLLGTTFDKYTSLQKAVTQVHDSNVDTTSFDQQTANDLQLFRTAKSAADFTNLDNQLNTQLQGLATLSTQAIPYVGAAKLQQFSSSIDTMKQAGIDITSYQQHLDADKAALAKARTLSDYLAFSTQVDSDVNSTRIPLLKAQATNLVQQFHQEVTSWGNTHQYLDPLDGQSYRLDYEYDQVGIGSIEDDDLAAAQTPDDYQAVVDLSTNDMFNLKQMEADYSDQTAWSQPHATDMQLLQHYKVTGAQVIMVSLIEQTVRVYQNGQLVKAFQVVTGQYGKPSLPGYWNIMDRESPTVFKSGEPKGSAFWYPDTNINFVIVYRSEGYFFHDSWWRSNYGPHTNFPHYNDSGDQAFAGNGSHGCVNIAEDNMGWLYNNTSYNTIAILY